MRSGTIAIVFGVVFALHVYAAHDPLWFQFLPLLLCSALMRRGTRLPALFVLGWLWAGLHVHLGTSTRLAAELQGEDIVVEGAVASIPRRGTLQTRFVFDVERNISHAPAVLPRLVLNWYRTAPELRAGQRWRLTVRLKQPHGYMNPGGFDYERWLFTNRLGATGYVRSNTGDNVRLDAHPVSLQRLRQDWVERLSSSLESHPSKALVLALGVGHKDLITPAQWRVLRDTGTSHLMAISGLHIGLVAGLAFWFTGRCWRRWPRGVRAAATSRICACTAIACALTYAALAGFSVPTQRALIMVMVVMSAPLFGRYMTASRSLAAAAFGVVALDPFAVLSVGFWLSFAAVGVMLVALPGAPSVQTAAPRAVWMKWGRVHVIVSLGLAPLTLYFFDNQSLVAPLANFVAVPWVGVAVVPVVLFGMLVSVFDVTFGAYVLQLGAWSLFAVWSYLEWLSALDVAFHPTYRVSLAVAVAAAFGVLIALLPAGVPGKWVGWLALMLLAGQAAHAPPAREIQLTVLDVGQGLAVVLRSEERVLVYDTGARYAGGFDTGRLVVVPYLRAMGIDKIDVLVVSHGDGDHAGGFRAISEALPVERVVSNVNFLPPTQACETTTKWRWGDVSFQVLSPLPESVGDSNNQSCVLRIVHPAATILLPGDIEASTESALLRRFPASELSADILVAPHHGSRTSSSSEFVAAVNPAYVVFPVGFRNRYRFPAGDVVARYRANGTRMYRSDEHGALTFVIKVGEPLGDPIAYRDDVRRPWHWRSDDNKQHRRLDGR